jgi:hypothetical protein
MRLVLAGTENRLAKPSEKDLALPDWDNSYLEWVDLSGLVVPPMEDADVIHYKATGTTFQNIDYAQFHYPIDISTAVFPSDMTSYAYDFTIEVIRRRAQELRGTRAGQLAQACHDYLMEGYEVEPYVRTWFDTLYMLMTTFGITADVLQRQLEPVFEPYPRMVERLRMHKETNRIGPDKSNQDRDWSQMRIIGWGRKNTIDLSDVRPATMTDRHVAARVIEVILEQRTGEKFQAWFARLIPYPVMFAVNAELVIGTGWWRRAWPT